MDLPFAVSDTYSFFIIMITFGLIIVGFTIIIFLNILFIKNNKIKNEQFYSQINKSFSELKESVDALGLMFSKIKDNLEDFKSDKKSHENLLSDFKSEITRIADGISGQDTMTKAIDLARSGSSAEKIVTETGLSKSDAEALIRFHKR